MQEWRHAGLLTRFLGKDHPSTLGAPFPGRCGDPPRLYEGKTGPLAGSPRSLARARRVFSRPPPASAPGAPPRVGFACSPLSRSWPGQPGPEAAALDARPCGGRASSRPVRVRSAPAGAWNSSRRRRSGSGQSGLPRGARRRTKGVRARPGLGLGAAPLQAPAPPRPPRRARRPSPAPARRAAAAAASPRGLRRSGRRRALGALRPVSRAAAPRAPGGNRRAPPAALGTRAPPAATGSRAARHPPETTHTAVCRESPSFAPQELSISVPR